MTYSMSDMSDVSGMSDVDKKEGTISFLGTSAAPHRAPPSRCHRPIGRRPPWIMKRNVTRGRCSASK